MPPAARLGPCQPGPSGCFRQPFHHIRILCKQVATVCDSSRPPRAPRQTHLSLSKRQPRPAATPNRRAGPPVSTPHPSRPAFPSAGTRPANPAERRLGRTSSATHSSDARSRQLIAAATRRRAGSTRADHAPAGRPQPHTPLPSLHAETGRHRPSHAPPTHRAGRRVGAPVWPTTVITAEEHSMYRAPRTSEN